uniref:Uncharacterized protein n=1 Tax=Sphaerodactylus townsendi TaxID=933632 RepID=A0ACB8EMQ8_9SAUR
MARELKGNKIKGLAGWGVFPAPTPDCPQFLVLCYNSQQEAQEHPMGGRGEEGIGTSLPNPFWGGGKGGRDTDVGLVAYLPKHIFFFLISERVKRSPTFPSFLVLLNCLQESESPPTCLVYPLGTTSPTLLSTTSVCDSGNFITYAPPSRITWYTGGIFSM